MDILKNLRQILRDQYDALEEQDAERTGIREPKPSTGIYDDAKWHYKVGFRKKVSKEQGATHIGFFLRWCEETGLLSEALLRELAEDRKLFADDLESWSFRGFVIRRREGLFRQIDLNEIGQAFADVFYTGRKTGFAQAYDTYLENYEEVVPVLYRLNGREYYCVKDILVNYEKVKQMLNQRYQEFLTFIPCDGPAPESTCENKKTN